MRSPLSITVLLFAFAPLVVAQDSNSVSLGDVARQTRAHAGTAAKSWNDQNSDFGRSTEDSGTPCGAPITSAPNGYVSTFIGRPVNDAELSKSLLHWFEKHPDLDVVHPEDLAKVKFPLTTAQQQANLAVAKAAADHWMHETAAIAQTGNTGDLNNAVNDIMETPLKTNADSILAQAVQAEQDRRVRSDGSAADKLQEAVNLYSICESRRQAQFEPDVDKMAKALFKKEFEAANAGQTQPAPNSQGHGL
ncbi:MAG TPA: hypothetical protein VMU28_03110 [Terriglobales bacterium]|nr:hypothetical protein [Terriglobales bacterium]